MLFLAGVTVFNTSDAGHDGPPLAIVCCCSEDVKGYISKKRNGEQKIPDWFLFLTTVTQICWFAYKVVGV